MFLYSIECWKICDFFLNLLLIFYFAAVGGGGDVEMRNRYVISINYVFVKWDFKTCMQKAWKQKQSNNNNQ